MVKNISNLVFEGGGVLGIAYLGVLDYLYRNNLTDNLKRTAGTSAGAIAACITSFGLPFEGVKAIGESLDYRRVPDRNGAADIDILVGLGFIETSRGVIGSILGIETSSLSNSSRPIAATLIDTSSNAEKIKQTFSANASRLAPAA